MAESRNARDCGNCSERFTRRLAENSDSLIRQALSSIASGVPELVGPSPRLSEVATRMLAANLENVRAAICCHAALENPFVPPANVEFARLVGQRDVPVYRMLLGYQLANRLLFRLFIDHAAAVAEDRDCLLGIVETVLTYWSSYGDAAVQTAISAHTASRAAWLDATGPTLTSRVDAVLSGTVTEEEVAERLLGHPISGLHVALVLWTNQSLDRRFALASPDGWRRGFPGVRDALVAPRDERTLLCWLRASDGARMDEWVRIAGELCGPNRIAFGEPEVGIEGFRRSNAQARAAANVLALARKEVGSVVRYRDVSAISFLAYQPVKARMWVESILGDLAGAGDSRDRLRHTLHVYLNEGEQAAAASRQLFVHRNTLKYRIDQASRMLPEPIERRRLDIALALSYCEWVSVWDMQPTGRMDPPSRDLLAYAPLASNNR